MLTLYAEHPHVKVSPAKPAPHAINWYKEYYWAAAAESKEKGHGSSRGDLSKIASRWAQRGKRLKLGPQGINVIDIEVAVEVPLMDENLSPVLDVAAAEAAGSGGGGGGGGGGGSVGGPRE